MLLQLLGAARGTGGAQGSTLPSAAPGPQQTHPAAAAQPGAAPVPFGAVLVTQLPQMDDDANETRGRFNS